MHCVTLKCAVESCLELLQQTIALGICCPYMMITFQQVLFPLSHGSTQFLVHHQHFLIIHLGILLDFMLVSSNFAKPPSLQLGVPRSLAETSQTWAWFDISNNALQFPPKVNAFMFVYNYSTKLILHEFKYYEKALNDDLYAVIDQVEATLKSISYDIIQIPISDVIDTDRGKFQSCSFRVYDFH